MMINYIFVHNRLISNLNNTRFFHAFLQPCGFYINLTWTLTTHLHKINEIIFIIKRINRKEKRTQTHNLCDIVKVIPVWLRNMIYEQSAH